VLGGSHFYLGHFEKAQLFLDNHVKTYSESKFIMHSEYFQSSNLTRLQYWERAASLLDTFLDKYPEPVKNIYLPNALYDRANCHFSESQYPPALTIIDRLENEFNGSVVIDMSYNMKGNIYESIAKFEDAEKYYLLALEIAEKRHNRLVAGEALSYLVGMLGVEKRDKKPNPRIKDAVPYYDKFMKEYKNLPSKPQVVVYGLPSLEAVGRLDEGLENLQAIISELAGRENQAFLEECVNAFSKSFLAKKGNTPEQLKDLYYDFPGINLSNQRALALLRIALIGVYEGEIQKAIKEKDENLQGKYESSVKILFRDLKSEFNPKDLSNFVLLKVADYLREKTSAPKQSLPYYKELLSRKDKFGEFKARLGIADVMGRSDNVAENKEALKQLAEVHKRSKEDPSTQEKALFRMVEINNKIEDWKACEVSARQYLEEKHSKNTALVSYFFAQSYDKRGAINDALVNYAMVYARYPGFIRISAPSVKRVMEMMWERDLKKGESVGSGDKAIKLDHDDRQAAYSGIGSKYIASTRRIRETNQKITDEEKDAWDEVAALVKTYEGSGLVKTLAQMKEERANTRRK
jgi:tetratricopeptide (TPR) repeat protein